MSKIAVAVTGNRVGSIYAAAGLRLSYVELNARDGQATKHAVAWGGGIVCVAQSIEHRRDWAWCDKGTTPERNRIANFVHNQ